MVGGRQHRSARRGGAGRCVALVRTSGREIFDHRAVHIPAQNTHLGRLPEADCPTRTAAKGWVCRHARRDPIAENADLSAPARERAQGSWYLHLNAPFATDPRRNKISSSWRMHLLPMVEFGAVQTIPTNSILPGKVRHATHSHIQTNKLTGRALLQPLPDVAEQADRRLRRRRDDRHGGLLLSGTDGRCRRTRRSSRRRSLAGRIGHLALLALA